MLTNAAITKILTSVGWWLNICHMCKAKHVNALGLEALSNLSRGGTVKLEYLLFPAGNVW